MPLMVDVLNRSPLPMVRLVVTGVPAGRAWRVMGDNNGYEWVAGEGVSTGDEVVFSDPLAPLGGDGSYVLRYTSSASPADIDDLGFGFLDFGEGPFGGSLVAVREFAGHDVVTDLGGRVVAQVRRADDDPWEFEPRGEFLTVPGDRYPSGTFADVAGAGGGELLVKTTGADTTILRGLVDANRPVVVLHNQANCQVPGCDVAPSSLVMFTGVSAARSGRVDAAERVWSIGFRHVARPHRFLAPVVTWEDVRAHFVDFAELAGTGMTNAQLARGDWVVAP